MGPAPRHPHQGNLLYRVYFLSIAIRNKTIGTSAPIPQVRAAILRRLPAAKQGRQRHDGQRGAWSCCHPDGKFDQCDGPIVHINDGHQNRHDKCHAEM